MAKAFSTMGLVEAHEQLQALGPIAEQAKLYIPEPARQLFDDLIVLRPASFWTPPYLRQLAQLSEAMYLISYYQEKEAKAAKKEDWLAAGRLSKLIAAKVTLVSKVQNALQLSPSQVNGKTHENKAKLIQDMMIRDISADPDQLYS